MLLLLGLIGGGGGGDRVDSRVARGIHTIFAISVFCVDRGCFYRGSHHFCR